MISQALGGGFADAPIQSARAFRAALEAMARPGRILTVEGVAPPAPLSIGAGVLLLTLCDRTTPLHLAPGHDGPEIRDWITFHTGAPLVTPGAAAFALGRWEALQPVTRFRIGQPDYPDRSATLIVEMDALMNDGAILTGPGIETTARLSLPELAAFRLNRDIFPLGYDALFTSDDKIAGLPRSTRVEAG